MEVDVITDLSKLEPDRLITPNAEPFVRTECPAAVAQYRGPWRIKTAGLAGGEGSVDSAAPAGLWLLHERRDGLRPAFPHSAKAGLFSHTLLC